MSRFFPHRRPARTAESPRPLQVDTQALMQLKNLQLRAKAVVEGFYNGLHRSPFHGFSAEFSEYRRYSPGDDPRYLDWRVFARTDRHYLKRFEDETNRRCYLLVDISRSMDYGTLDHTKAQYAKTLAATLAYYLMQQRDSVGLITFDQDVRDFLPARARPGHLHRLLHALEGAAAGNATDLQKPLQQLAALVRKRGLVVLISDLLASTDSLRQDLGYLRSRGHEVLVLRVLDPAEREFPFEQATLFVDLESGREMYVDPQRARKHYLDQFEQHRRQLQELCGELGIDLTEMSTDQPLGRALVAILTAQIRRGRRPVHRGATRAATAKGVAP